MTPWKKWEGVVVAERNPYVMGYTDAVKDIISNIKKDFKLE